MSELAEFARVVHESKQSSDNRLLEPVEYPARCRRLGDIRAVIVDVYGTLVNYWREEFADADTRETALLGSFGEVADRFGMIPSLRAVNPADPPEKTLRDFYHGLISLRQQRGVKEGIEYSEIKIEEIWGLIVTLLSRHGYDPSRLGGDDSATFSRKIAWFYNYKALGRTLYPGVVETLEALKKKNMVLGILSNGQFYTPVDLTLMIRDQSGGRFEDIYELFDTDLTFFSYEYLVAKPGELLFRKLFDALYEFQILPEQTLMVGNDLAIDIAAAQRLRMKTAFFAGDRHCAFMHEQGGKTVPDLVFTSWTDLIEQLSFHAEEEE